MSEPKVTLQVELNAGLYSLVEMAPGERSSRQLPGNLLSNDNPVSFYRAVAHYIADWADKGVPVDYRDIDPASMRDYPDGLMD